MPENATHPFIPPSFDSVFSVDPPAAVAPVSVCPSSYPRTHVPIRLPACLVDAAKTSSTPAIMRLSVCLPCPAHLSACPPGTQPPHLQRHVIGEDDLGASAELLRGVRGARVELGQQEARLSRHTDSQTLPCWDMHACAPAAEQPTSTVGWMADATSTSERHRRTRTNGRTDARTSRPGRHTPPRLRRGWSHNRTDGQIGRQTDRPGCHPGRTPAAWAPAGAP
jgi:hypothetical protein